MSSRMREIRERKGLGQKEVAAKLGMPVRTYGGYERGERTLSLNVAAEIADVFDVTLDELLGREIRNRLAHSLPLPNNHETLVNELVDICGTLNDQQIELLISTAKNFAVANEKDGAGNSENVDRAGIALNLD